MCVHDGWLETCVDKGLETKHCDGSCCDTDGFLSLLHAGPRSSSLKPLPLLTTLKEHLVCV